MAIESTSRSYRTHHQTRSKGIPRTRTPSKAFAGCEITDATVANYMKDNFKEMLPQPSSDNPYTKAKKHRNVRQIVYERPVDREIGTPNIGDRLYTDEVSYLTPSSKTAFATKWEQMELPKQNKNFVNRCKHYFAKLEKDERDPILSKVKVADCDDPDLGKGVKAIVKIKDGTLLGHYAGIMRSISGYDPSRYIFGFSGIDLGNWSIDAAIKGNVLSCVNHSENPNVRVHEYYGKDGPRIVFFADKDIEKGQELFITYGNEYWQDVGAKPKQIAD